MGTAIQDALFAMQDEGYRDFHAKLCPTVPRENIIGVRTPALRAYAKTLYPTPEGRAFMAALPHRYQEENQLHGFMLSEIKDYDTTLAQLKAFLPYIDNWAVCDQTSPKIFRRHRDRLICEIPPWLASGETYTVRFGIGMLMEHYLDWDFRPEYLEWVRGVQSGEYYINMMIAWYFATALAKQPGAAFPYLTEGRLDVWVHNRTIQKARESRRISEEEKDFLKTLKRR